jgi:hypothetical protein
VATPAAAGLDPADQVLAEAKTKHMTPLEMIQKTMALARGRTP